MEGSKDLLPGSISPAVLISEQKQLFKKKSWKCHTALEMSNDYMVNISFVSDNLIFLKKEPVKSNILSINI